MSHAFPVSRLLITLAAALGLAACGTQLAPPTLYVLKPAVDRAAAQPVARLTPPLSLQIAPTVLPEYLDRAEIVGFAGANEVRPNDDQRWAERLGIGITRVTAENLATLLPSALVTLPPGRGRQGVDWDLVLDITRFDLDDGGRASIAGRWTLHDANNDRLLATGRIDLSRANGGAAMDARISAMNANLAEIATSIATTLSTLPPPAR